MTAIYGSHVTHNTSVRNSGRCLAYLVSKYEQNLFKFKEIMATEISISPLKEVCRILLMSLKIIILFL